MTVTKAIIENIPTSCNYDATHSTTLTQIPNFVIINGCIIPYYSF